MYPVLIKDRGYPVHIYLQYMMKVMDVSRTDAAKRMSDFAFEKGFRRSNSVPLNNTLSDWLRTSKTPKWAMISCMQILESIGRSPQTSQEWAFWAMSKIETFNIGEPDIPEEWCYEEALSWVKKAYNYKYWNSMRFDITKIVEKCSDPVLATKIICNTLGNDQCQTTMAELFFTLDCTQLSKEQVKSAIKNNVKLNLYQVEHVRLNNKSSDKLFLSIANHINQLSKMAVMNCDDGDRIVANEAVVKCQLGLD